MPEEPQAANMPSPRLTLIVAVTPSNGIGRAGTLPWPRIKSEMAYFARVTKRAGGAAPQSADSSSSSIPLSNAVIMGRKTWESIPAKFRPLPDRVNVVVTRQPDKLDLGLGDGAKGAAFAVSSLQEGIRELQARSRDGGLGRVFVIGGAQIYAEALRAREADRVLLTRIKQDYDCDTFFPVKFGTGEGEAAEWRLQDEGVRDEWLGEKSPGGDEWHVEMWVRDESAA